MKYIIAFPTLAIVIGAYLLMASGGDMLIDGDAYSATLMSGTELTLRGGDFFVIAGLVALFLEMAKLAGASMIDNTRHVLAILTFIVAANCFVMLDYAGTPGFLMLTIMALAVVLANGVASFRNARSLTP